MRVLDCVMFYLDSLFITDQCRKSRPFFIIGIYTLESVYFALNLNIYLQEHIYAHTCHLYYYYLLRIMLIT